MRIITTHLSADFDAFAAAVCTVRLYPDHHVLFPGSQEAAGAPVAHTPIREQVWAQ